MAFVQATPGLWVNWELKDYPEVCGQDFALRSADGLLRAIADYDLTDRSMLNSFSSEVLEYVAAESCGEMPIHGQGVAPTSRHAWQGHPRPAGLLGLGLPVYRRSYHPL